MAKKEPLYPHVPKSKYPRNLPTTRTSEEFIPARDRPYKSSPGRIEPAWRMKHGPIGKTQAEAEYEYEREHTIKTQGGFTLTHVYQRAPDGYPVGADKVMRDAYGPIPNPYQTFWGKQGFIKLTKIYGWSWSEDYHTWRAFVRFPDGQETWISPFEQRGVISWAKK